jgi:hypothetical protein
VLEDVEMRLRGRQVAPLQPLNLSEEGASFRRRL